MGSDRGPWRAIPTWVMQTCCHGILHALTRGFGAKLLTPAASQPPRHTDTLSPRHSLSLYLSISPFPSLPPSLSLRQGKMLQEAGQAMSKDQNASGKKVFGNDAWSDAVRYLERYPKSAEVDRPPDLERRRQLLPDFEEHGRKHPTAAEKVEAAACARKCVLQAKWRASPTSLRPGFFTSSDEA